MRAPTAGSTAVLLLSVGAGLGLGGATDRATAATPTSRPVVFQSDELVPGNTVTGYLNVPGAAIPVSPYVKVEDLRDGCRLTPPCGTGAPLSQTLQLVVTAPDGEAVHGTPAQLARLTTLPGGVMPTGTVSRRYAISLVVPASLDDDSADRSVAFDLEWGGQDASGTKVTSVLGETFSKTPPAGGSPSTGGGHDLPFTGSAATIELEVGGVAVLVGTVLLLAGRRRRAPR